MSGGNAQRAYVHLAGKSCSVEAIANKIPTGIPQDLLALKCCSKEMYMKTISLEVDRAYVGSNSKNLHLAHCTTESISSVATLEHAMRNLGQLLDAVYRVKLYSYECMFMDTFIKKVRHNAYKDVVVLPAFIDGVVEQFMYALSQVRSVVEDVEIEEVDYLNDNSPEEEFLRVQAPIGDSIRKVLDQTLQDYLSAGSWP